VKFGESYGGLKVGVMEVLEREVGDERGFVYGPAHCWNKMCLTLPL